MGRREKKYAFKCTCVNLKAKAERCESLFIAFFSFIRFFCAISSGFYADFLIEMNTHACTHAYVRSNCVFLFSFVNRYFLFGDSKYIAQHKSDLIDFEYNDVGIYVCVCAHPYSNNNSAIAQNIEAAHSPKLFAFTAVNSEH